MIQKFKELCDADAQNPFHYHLLINSLENPRDRGAWWAAIYGVAQR